MLSLKKILKKIDYLWIQWAAVRIQCSSIRTPPHQWPMNPSLGCKSCKDTCQGQDPLLLGLPLKMRPVVDCLPDVALGCLCEIAGHPHSILSVKTIVIVTITVKCDSITRFRTRALKCIRSATVAIILTSWKWHCSYIIFRVQIVCTFSDSLYRLNFKSTFKIYKSKQKENWNWIFQFIVFY